MAELTKNTLSVSKIDTIKGFENVFSFASQSLNVKGIIAIHNTLKGPALGGLRVYNYPNFQAGMKDVLLLARAMTFKNTLMELPYGGGKAVIFQTDKCNRDNAFEVFAELLNRLNGKYLTTDDVGTSVNDMYHLRKFTNFARGTYCNGKQIPATSYGVYQAIKATFNYYHNLNRLNGIKIVVQGLGKVGYHLCQYLHQEGCKLYVNDKIAELVTEVVQKFDAVPINLDKIDNFQADVFSPCAVGGTINKNLLSKMQVKYIIGGENNPLASQEIEKILLRKGIIYIPDYLSNAGGVIDIVCEGSNYSEEFVLTKVARIYDKTKEILNMAQSANKTPLEISNQYVLNQLNSINSREMVLSESV